MRIEVDERGRVNAACDLDLPLPASTVWGQMRDWQRFLTIDPLHARVRVTSRPAPAGASSPMGTGILIQHRLLGIGPDRIGRILRWREGSCLAFSDLSQRGCRVGFPHICMFQLQPLQTNACRLTISAWGRWTAARWPRWAVRLWLRWVLVETRRCVREEFQRYCAWRDARQET